MDRHKAIISDSGQGYRGPGGGVEELRLERGVRSQGESRRGQQASRATATATGKSWQDFSLLLLSLCPTPSPPVQSASQAPTGMGDEALVGAPGSSIRR